MVAGSIPAGGANRVQPFSLPKPLDTRNSGATYAQLAGFARKILGRFGQVARKRWASCVQTGAETVNAGRMDALPEEHQIATEGRTPQGSQ